MRWVAVGCSMWARLAAVLVEHTAQHLAGHEHGGAVLVAVHLGQVLELATEVFVAAAAGAAVEREHPALRRGSPPPQPARRASIEQAAHRASAVMVEGEGAGALVPHERGALAVEGQVHAVLLDHLVVGAAPAHGEGAGVATAAPEPALPVLEGVGRQPGADLAVACVVHASSTSWKGSSPSSSAAALRLDPPVASVTLELPGPQELGPQQAPPAWSAHRCCRRRWCRRGATRRRARLPDCSRSRRASTPAPLVNTSAVSSSQPSGSPLYTRPSRSR